MEVEKLKDLYVLARYRDGEFVGFIRKGRNHSVSGYDTLESAKRGYSQSKRATTNKGYELKILKASSLSDVTE